MNETIRKVIRVQVLNVIAIFAVPAWITGDRYAGVPYAIGWYGTLALLVIVCLAREGFVRAKGVHRA